MTTEIGVLAQEAPEGGYQARALAHSIYTEADTLPELRAMLQDAVRCHFDDTERPAVIRLHLVHDELMAV
jgi:hypothetical protein